MSRALRGMFAVLAVLAVALVSAHAASLPLRSSHLDGYSYAHPCPAPVVVAPPAGGGAAVTVTWPDAACAGTTVRVTLLDATGATLANGMTIVGGAEASVGVGPYNVAAVLVAAVSVDGWATPATWNAPSGPVYEEDDNTVMTTITWTLVTNNPVQACFDADVTTASSTPVPWALTIDRSRAPFNGVGPTGFVLQGKDGWRYILSDAGGGLTRLAGKPGAGRETVVAGQTHHVGVCHYGLPPGVQTPGAYGVTSAPGPGAWTAKKACVTHTVTGNGTERFYFGWTAVVDMGPAVDHLVAGGHAFSAYTYGRDEWMLTRTPAPDIGPYAFRVTSKSPSNIADEETFAFSTCAVSW